MSNKSGNKIAVRAIAASLVVVGTLAGASQGIAMEPWNHRNNSNDLFLNKQYDLLEERGKVTKQLADAVLSGSDNNSQEIKELKIKHEALKQAFDLGLDGMNAQISLYKQENAMKQLIAQEYQAPVMGNYFPIVLENNNKITVQNLQDNKNIISLDLTENDKISGSDLGAYCKNLTSLNLTRNKKISGSDLGIYCKNIISLDLTENDKISGSDLRVYCKNLTSLNLTKNKKISGSDLGVYCKNIISLDLTENDKISGSDLGVYCKNLTSLNLTKNKKISGSDLEFYCKNLKWLNLTENTKISYKDVQSIRKKNPGLLIIGR